MVQAQPIGAHNSRALNVIAFRRKPHFVTKILVADDVRFWHELDVAICFACIKQDVVQIDPVNDNVWVFKINSRMRRGSGSARLSPHPPNQA